MAKRKDENPEFLENEVQEGAAQAAQEATIEDSIPKVKIHTTAEIDSIISGIRYSFAKDKTVSVPSDVAAILTFSRKAYRI